MISPDELVVDNFAGGGGASLGIERALGRPVDIAINHDPEAVAMHRANHPDTEHLCQNIWQVDPRDAVKGRRIGLAWFSPDCTHHSKAKGGKPLKRNIRDLAWVVVHWAKLVRPRIIMLENVEEFRDWGPLDDNHKPIVDLKGQTFLRWVREIKRLGYKVEWRELRACDFGAPTIRKRLFLIARCDGEPIIWPTPTHGLGLLPYRTAAEIIDWSLPCPSIFLTREECRARGIRAKRPLAENTMRRIAKGVMRYVVNAKEPFIVTCNHGGDWFRGQGVNEPFCTVNASRDAHGLIVPYIARTDMHQSNAGCVYGMDEPLRTVTSGGGFGVVAPTLIQTGYGERPGQSPRVPGLDKPLGTQVAGGAKHAVVAAFLAQHNTDMVGHDARKPLSTIVQKGCTQGVVAAHMISLKGSERRDGPVDQPGPCITARGGHAAVVASFLTKYYGTDQAPELTDPMHTETTKPRFSLVKVEIDGQTYVISDIGMRMLTPRERFRAQGFPDSYKIDPEVNGKPLTQEAQGRNCGNSVCPDVAAAVVQANAGAVEMRAAE